MSSDTDLGEQIATAAQRPARVQTDGFVAEAHPLPDLIAADKHLERKAAGRAGGLPLRVFRGVPPGAV